MSWWNNMLDSKRWSQFSFAQQIGHIGSEISRARHWEEKNEKTNKDSALIRALELIDLTIEDKKKKGGIREIVRLREFVCDQLTQTQAYEITLRELQTYCETFCLSHIQS